MTDHSTASIRGGAAGGGLFIALLLGMGLMLYLNFGPTGSDGSSSVERALDAKDKAEETRHTLDLHQWNLAIVAYYLSNNAMPETIDDIPEMKVMVDQYDTPYQYELVDARQKTYRVISAGIDLEFGTDDDVVAEGKANI